MQNDRPATSGSSRTSAGRPPAPAARSEQLRLPVPPDDTDGPDRGRHAAGAAGAARTTARRSPPPQLQADPHATRSSAAAHLRRVVPTQWVTVDAGTERSTRRRAKAAGATPFKRPENGVFRPGRGSASSTSPRPATPTPQHAAGRLRRRLPAHPAAPSASTGSSRRHRRRRGAHRPRQHLLRHRGPAAGRRGRRRRPARRSATPRLRLRLDLRRHARRDALVRWLAEGRDASATYDALTAARLQRRRQRDHRHPRLQRRPERRPASSAPRSRSRSRTAGASSGPSSTATTYWELTPAEHGARQRIEQRPWPRWLPRELAPTTADLHLWAPVAPCGGGPGASMGWYVTHVRFGGSAPSAYPGFSDHDDRPRAACR